MSRIQIHHLAPLTRSSRVMWLLEELGPQAQAQVDIKTYDLVKPETFQTDEFRQISPLARFPVLVHGDLVLLESVAINNYILRTLAPESPLLPADSRELALVESVSAFTIAHIDDLTFRGAMETFFTPIEKKSPTLLSELKETFAKDVAPFLNSRLKTGTYLAGDRFTVADINCALILLFARNLQWLGDHARLNEYLDLLINTRPAFATLARTPLL